MPTTTPVGRRLNLGQSLRLLQGALQLKTIVPEHTHGAAGTGTGGPITGVAPVDAEYLVGTANGTLTAERVVTDTATITWDLTTAGQAKANAVGTYTDEQAQDAVGNILTDTASIDFTYDDGTPKITADVKFAGATPQDVASAAAVGTGTTPSHEDHKHKGVVSVNGVSGAVTIGGTGGTSPGRVNDPLTTVYDYEEFLNNIGNAGQLGKLGWTFINSSVTFVASEASHIGICSKLQNNNAGSLNIGFAGATGLILPAEFFDNYFIVRPQNFDGNLSLWIGYQDSTTATGEAGNMILFEALTTDTNWFTVTRTGSGTVQRQDTTIACTTGNWYTFRIRRIDASTIGFTVVTVNGAASGVSEFTETSQIPTVALGWALRMRSHTAANRTCEIDYWDQLITGITR